MRPNATAWQARTGALDASVRPGELILGTDEDWIAATNGNCAQDGVFATARYTSALGVARLERLATYRVGRGGVVPTDRKPQGVVSCSSHYFDHRADGIVAVSWYEQGTRFLDVSDPRNIRPVGYFVPLVGEAVATRWNGDYLYAFDTYRGMDILRFTGGSSSLTSDGPVVPVMHPQPPADTRFGGACRIAA